jgi:hypothetical protein
VDDKEDGCRGLRACVVIFFSAAVFSAKCSGHLFLLGFSSVSRARVLYSLCLI